MAPPRDRGFTFLGVTFCTQGVFNLKQTESCARGCVSPFPQRVAYGRVPSWSRWRLALVGCVAQAASHEAAVAITSSSLKGALAKGLLSGPRDMRPLGIKGYRKPCAGDPVASPLPTHRMVGRHWSSALKRLSSRASKGRSFV